MRTSNKKLVKADVINAVIDSSNVAFLLFENGKLYYANQRADELLVSKSGGGQHAADILPSELYELMRRVNDNESDSPLSREFELRFASDQSIWMETTISNLQVDGRVFQQLSLKDISKSKQRESELEKQATTDDLSGLSNRRQFRRVLDSNADQKLAIAMVDVDHFKSINDSFGHSVGDNAIRFVAAELISHFSNALCIARLGGEEFGVVARNENPDQVEADFENFRLAIQDSQFSNETLKLTVSIGLAFSRPVVSLSDLLSQADQALYESKNSGRNRLTVAHI